MDSIPFSNGIERDNWYCRNCGACKLHVVDPDDDYSVDSKRNCKASVQLFVSTFFNEPQEITDETVAFIWGDKEPDGLTDCQNRQPGLPLTVQEYDRKQALWAKNRELDSHPKLF